MNSNIFPSFFLDLFKGHKLSVVVLPHTPIIPIDDLKNSGKFLFQFKDLIYLFLVFTDHNDCVGVAEDIFRLGRGHIGVKANSLCPYGLGCILAPEELLVHSHPRYATVSSAFTPKEANPIAKVLTCSSTSYKYNPARSQNLSSIEN